MRIQSVILPKKSYHCQDGEHTGGSLSENDSKGGGYAHFPRSFFRFSLQHDKKLFVIFDK